MSGNPWEPTAPMGPVGAKAPPPGHAPAGPHWPTPHPPAPPTPGDNTQTAPLRQRRWLAALALFLLAPITMVVLTGAITPLPFVSPLTFAVPMALYGSGALAIREVTRRRGLGWWGILLLGASLGVMVEWPVAMGQFNPFWLGGAYLGGSGGALGVNWYWALGLTALYTVVGVALPITLVEAAFPSIAPLPWTRRRWLPIALGTLMGAALIGLFAFGFADLGASSYLMAPAGALPILALMLALGWLGTHPLGRLWRHTQGERTIPPVVNQRHAPPLGTLRFAGFGFTLLFYVAFARIPQIIHQPWIGLAALILTLAAPALVVSRWSHRIDWSPRWRLALLTGVALFFVALAPLVEYVIKPADKDAGGMTLFAVAALAGLIWLAHSARRTEERRLGQP